ncbi:cell division protein ZipA [Ectothiorhodospira magna]|uniref:Cell division protein ZipA n=1 Tax=Ectothiorhodospira magna TaxID=867345 RepID=A0A1H9DHY0_9GAMM|nr:cell division protein ZipA [Ectothiorhodospira magna]SEQ12348.1 cell division protein ZipA [Ectothiorhodospira magna]
MDTLRWILLILGITILVGIYLAGRKRAPKRPRDLPRDRDDLEPDELEHVHIRADEGHKAASPPEDEALNELRGLVADEVRDSPVAPSRTSAPADPAGRTGEGTDTATSPPPAAMTPLDPVGPPPKDRPEPPALPPKLVVLHVMAGENEQFLGPDLAKALTAEGMEFGDMDIYHYLVTEGRRQLPVFSLANMLNPGTFDLESIDQFTTPGVTLFLQLPGPCDPLESFDAMYHCAEGLAERLGGQVLDAARAPLNRADSERLREDIRHWQQSGSAAGTGG